MTESRVYLDANVFIYAVEGNPDVAGQLRDLFDLFRRAGVTSELTLAEVLPKASTVQKRVYLDLIVWSRIFDLQPVSRDILIETAEYQKVARMPKLPDAIHVVTAIRARCRMILSADTGLRLPEGHAAFLPNSANIARLIRELS